MKLTIKEAKRRAKILGCVLTKTEGGDFEIKFEGSSYFTNDLEDAVNTGQKMVESRKVKSVNIKDLGTYNEIQTFLIKGDKDETFVSISFCPKTQNLCVTGLPRDSKKNAGDSGCLESFSFRVFR